jgi:hypothetical protein
MNIDMKHYLTMLLLCFSITKMSAQDVAQDSLFKTLCIRDSLLFEVGYNHCDISQFDSLLSDDFEFYHDEAGITAGKAAFITGVRDGLCRLPYKAKRVLVRGSLAVFPLRKGDSLYGAMQTGRHWFYAQEKNGTVRLTSKATFMHLWLLQGGRWKLSRGFSYDHQQPRRSARKK